MVPSVDMMKRPIMKRDPQYKTETIQINDQKIKCISIPPFWFDCIFNDNNNYEYEYLKCLIPSCKDTRDEGSPFLHKQSLHAKMTPYANQQNVINLIFEQFDKTGSATVVVPTGGGKTLIGSVVIHKIGRRTMIAAHKNLLLEQFKVALENYFSDISLVRIGYLHDNMDFDKYDIVLGTVQSITKKPKDFFGDSFGLLVIDEAHHIAASVIQTTLDRFNSARSLGLTATPDRNDKRSDYVYWAVGPCAYFQSAKFTVPTTFHIYNIHIKESKGNSVHKSVKRLKENGMKHHIADDHQRNMLAASLVNKGGFLENKHGIIFIDFIEHAMGLANLIPGSDVFVGEFQPTITQKQKKNGYNRCIFPFGRVIIATDGSFGEGMNNPEIEFVIHLRPKPNIIQSTGRGVRESQIIGSSKNVDLIYFVDHCWYACTKKFKVAREYVESSFVNLTIKEYNVELCDKSYFLAVVDDDNNMKDEDKDSFIEQFSSNEYI
jgi:superfamily II DNA or RNA helicase